MKKYSIQKYSFSTHLPILVPGIIGKEQNKIDKNLCLPGAHILSRESLANCLGNRAPIGASSLIKTVSYQLLLYFTCFCCFWPAPHVWGHWQFSSKNQTHSPSQSNFHLDRMYAKILRLENLKLFADTTSDGSTATANRFPYYHLR